MGWAVVEVVIPVSTAHEPNPHMRVDNACTAKCTATSAASRSHRTPVGAPRASAAGRQTRQGAYTCVWGCRVASGEAGKVKWTTGQPVWGGAWDTAAPLSDEFASFGRRFFGMGGGGFAKNERNDDGTGDDGAADDGEEEEEEDAPEGDEDVWSRRDRTCGAYCFRRARRMTVPGSPSSTTAHPTCTSWGRSLFKGSVRPSWRARTQR